MSVNIPDYFQKEFSSTWESSLLQQTSILEGLVTPYPFDGKWKEMDFLDDFETETYTGRAADVTLSEVTGDKRYVLNVKGHPTKTPFLDQWDESMLGKKIAPGGELMNRLVYAKNRYMDKQIYDAAIGTVYSGTDGPTTANSLPAAQSIASGSTGMTFAKVAMVAQYAQDNGFDLSEMTWIISARDHRSLLTDVAELRSRDYSTVEPITNGSVFGTTWMGMNWKHGRGIVTGTVSGSNTLYAPICFAKRAIYRNPGSSKAAIEERPDKDGAIQFRTSWLSGVARARDEGVFKVNTQYVTSS